MRPDVGMKSLRKSPDKRQEPYSLHATLDQYEVEELDAKRFLDLINQPRLKGNPPPPVAL